jgi:NAD(P)H-hydrate epimerase
MKTLTVEQMREADRRCIEELGIPSAVLMNNAGAAVFSEIHHGPVGVVCGKGNNGGDGFVVARLALLAGYATDVVVVAERDALEGDPAVFLGAYERLGGAVRFTPGADQAVAAVRQLGRGAVIVDALLGTGISGEVRGVYRPVIDAWPQTRTLAVDVPSGLNADTGEPCGTAVPAEVTVTFQFAKHGLVQDIAKPYVGRLVVADIGIPDVCGDDDAWRQLRG